MKQREYRVGPGAVSLLLIIVVVSMSVLGLLSLISAKGDYKLTERAKDFAIAEAVAADAAERRFSALDSLLVECAAVSADDAAYFEMIRGGLPEKMNMEDGIIKWTEETTGGRVLKCAVIVYPLGSEERCAWYEHAFEVVEYEGYDQKNFDMWE